MIARVGSATRERHLRVMGQLSRSSVYRGEQITTTGEFGTRYLHRDNLDPSGVPPFPLPALYAHSAQAQKGDGAVSFSQFDAVANLHIDT